MSDKNTYRSVFRSNLLQGKVALVTGGGTGIGRAIVTELASLGCTVVIASRNQARCEETAVEITKELGLNGNKVMAGPSTTIRNEEQVHALIAFVIQKCGSLDLLVNNAGGQFISPSEKISSRGFAAVVETNLVGTFLVCREAYNQWMKRHGGSIVNISVGNRNGYPYMAHSGAARSGVENLTASLCTEWIQSKVRINCVRPGVIFTESGFENYGKAGEMFLGKILPTMPAKRFGSAQEVSSAVVWLLSDGASYVTGAILCVDGGSSYTFLPLVPDNKNPSHLPVYGTLSPRARL